MQPDQPYDHRADAVPENGDSLGDILASLDHLIAELEAAPSGSEALDARIHFGFRVMAERIQDHATLLISEGISWPTVKSVLEDIIPPFTTSLDASLDGERIVFVLRSAKRRRWGAMQRASCGEEALGWARTEPLARRLAFLKSWRADLIAAVKKMDARGDQKSDKPSDALSREKEQSPPAAVANTSGDADTAARKKDAADDKDWEVLF